MTRIQKIREDIFHLQCLDRESSIVSVDDLEWSVRQLERARVALKELCGAMRALQGDGQALSSEGLQGAEAVLHDLEAELSLQTASH